MLNRPRSTRGAPETTLLLVLLLTLALAGVLAYQAQDAARSHRRAAEAALRDYAAFASWELGRQLESGMMDALQSGLLRGRMAIDMATWGEGDTPARHLLAIFAAAAEAELAECRCPEAVHDFFVLDLASGEVELRDGRLPPSFRSWLADSLRAEARSGAERVKIQRQETSAGPGERIIQRVETQEIIEPEERRTIGRMTFIRPAPRLLSARSLPGHPSVSVMHTILPDRSGEPAKVYGFAVQVPAFAGSVTRRVVESAALLPPSLTGGTRNEEVLALAVESAAGDTLYRSPGRFASATEVVDTVEAVGSLVTRVGVRPEIASALVIGGLPRSRLPLLLGVFVLTLGLFAVAALQLRRQRELIRLRGDFISGVSHELRTPLAQIRLFSELLESDRLRQEQRQRSVRIINEEARRLTYLVENILQFSRSERRANRIAPEPTEVAPLVREIVEAFAPLARAREVRLHTHLQEGVTAPLDRDALRQVLLNLLDNAVKYGPRGQRIDVGMETADRQLRLWVDDEGPGIPAEERERVWEPYRRLARDVESATGGSGIGLAVVRELVELHGGEVSIGGSPAGGARFTVLLPHAIRSERPAEVEADTRRSAGEGVRA